VVARSGGRSSPRGASMADGGVWAYVWDSGRLLKARTSVHGRARLLHDAKEGTRGRMRRRRAATGQRAARAGLDRGGSSARRVAWRTLSKQGSRGEGHAMMVLPSSRSCASWGPCRGAPAAAWHHTQTHALYSAWTPVLGSDNACLTASNSKFFNCAQTNLNTKVVK
jgi:hypothetical protein